MQLTRQLNHKGKVCYSAKTNLLKRKKKDSLINLLKLSFP